MLAGFPIFADLWQEHLAKLEKMAREMVLKKGAGLFGPGDPTQGFYVVQEGAVRLYRISPQGKEITQEIASPGSAFALASLYSDTYHCFADALKDSRLYLIKKKQFLDLIATDPKFAAEWIRLLSLLVIRLRSRLSDLTLKSPKARIASYILLLSETHDSLSITLPVSRKELATFLGMTHETFYRSTRELVGKGLIRFARQTVEILDRDMLTEIVD
ncbi:MAG: Crp/Fnr family transcriptional regulator [Deltaproteobacteria bacterium]|nr:Crp/Fnr family transcriptional regulator [Deltaproteobacteria bacterium]